MKEREKELLLLQLIRYVPLVFIILLFLLVITYISTIHSQNLKNEKENTKNEFIQLNKTNIKTSIDNTVVEFIKYELKDSQEKLETKLKKQVNSIHSIMTSLYNEYKEEKTKEEIIKLIKLTLKSVSLDEEKRYFFIYDLNGVNIFHPTKPQREGTNFYDAKDTNGRLIVQDSINIAKSKSKEGFQTYFFHKPNDENKEYEKLGFIKKFEPYNWFIGTGEYLDDFQKKVNKKILEHLSVIKYKYNEYVFVLDYNGNILINKNKKFSDINIFNSNRVMDAKIKYKDFISSNEKRKFIEYKMKSDDEKDYIKISYVTKIEELNWVVGTGFNLDNVNSLIKEKQKVLEKSYKEHLNIFLIVSICLTIILLVISYYVSNYIKSKFTGYQDNLKHKNRVLLKAQEIARLGEWELDIQTRKAYWSNKIVDIFGIKNCKQEHGPKFLKTLMYDADWSCFESSIEKCIETKKEHHCTYRIKRPIDGKTIWVECRGEIINDNTILGTIQDITEVKQKEIEAQNKDKILYQQSKLATMGEMLSNIAHQWKQPLSTISTASTGIKLQKEMNSLSDDQLISDVETINNSAQYLAQTIDDFKNFFKPNKNRVEEFNISSTIEKTLKLLDAKFKAQEIEIIKDIEDINIRSSENELIQVLMNILNNARDELLKCDYRKLIFITIYKKENSLFIEIKDNANGVPLDMKKKIFDAYFTTKDESKGTGIGLYMSKDIVTKLLDGDIFVENEAYTYEDNEYYGAKFSIKLNFS
ncbi:cache domain-containing protein [Poseidonibacter ostreae]|nr:cache domain-containing protein [Poseidonibacter ostreae]